MADAYLDHAATTTPRPEALEAVSSILGSGIANPSGSHRRARDARRRLDDARDVVAELVGAEPREVIFTSGGTEANDLAIRGVAAAVEGAVLCSAVEHRAVLEPVLAVGGSTVPVDDAGRVDQRALGASLDAEAVGLVSVMAANNETGAVNDLDEIGAVLDRSGGRVLLHTDAVAAAAWMDLASATARADLVTVSAHKLGGLMGTGALVVRRGTPLQARLIGGGQEMERRAGTPNLAGAVAFAAAAAATIRDRNGTIERIEGLRRRLIAGLEGIEGLVVLSPKEGPRTAGTVAAGIAGVDREALLMLLDDAGIAASWGSSCASGASEPSHVLAAMGVDGVYMAGSLRLSLGWDSTESDVDAVLAVLPEAVDRLRGVRV